jgi:hypothetical protein
VYPDWRAVVPAAADLPVLVEAAAAEVLAGLDALGKCGGEFVKVRPDGAGGVRLDAGGDGEATGTARLSSILEAPAGWAGNSVNPDLLRAAVQFAGGGWASGADRGVPLRFEHGPRLALVMQGGAS